MKTRKTICLLTLIFCTAVLPAICYSSEKETIIEFSDTATIRHGNFYEKCVTLRPRQEFSYRFEASAPVYFNIHYHGEHGREYLTEKESIAKLESSISEFQYKKAYTGVSRKAMLCMLWRNHRDDPVELSLEYSATKR